ncbi:MAG: SPOR domain-containing protein [Pseudomonadota bacterium]
MTTAIKISAAELEIKRRGRRRLIGAGTIGLLAIVILPMVFDSEPKRQDTSKQEIAIQIPPKEGLPPLPAPIVPASSSQATTATDVIPAIPAPSPGSVLKPAAKIDLTSKPVLVEPKGESKMDLKPESVPAAKSEVKPKAAPKVEPAKSGFVVQVGAYKDADNAKSIVAQLKEAKLPVFTDTIAVKAGKVIRVRVGPFPTKGKAASALAQVKLAGADGKIVPLQ